MKTRRVRSMPATTGRAVRSSLPATPLRAHTELERLTQERERLIRVRSNWIDYQSRTEAKLAAVDERLTRLRERLGLQPPTGRQAARQSLPAAGASGSKSMREVDLEY